MRFSPKIPGRQMMRKRFPSDAPDLRSGFEVKSHNETPPLRFPFFAYKSHLLHMFTNFLTFAYCILSEIPKTLRVLKTSPCSFEILAESRNRSPTAFFFRFLVSSLIVTSNPHSWFGVETFRKFLGFEL